MNRVYFIALFACCRELFNPSNQHGEGLDYQIKQNFKLNAVNNYTEQIRFGRFSAKEDIMKKSRIRRQDTDLEDQWYYPNITNLDAEEDSKMNN